MKTDITEEMKFRQKVVEYAIKKDIELSHMFDNYRIDS